MEEKSEIDELRAKVIASMRSPATAATTNGAATAIAVADDRVKPRLSDNSREEGELSDEQPPELPTEYVAEDKKMPSPASTIKETVPSSDARKVAPVGKLSVVNMQHQKSKMKTNQRHLNTKQRAFRYRNNQVSHWPNNVASDNLVISFSDEESDSDSERPKPDSSFRTPGLRNRADMYKPRNNSVPVQKEAPYVNLGNKIKQIPKMDTPRSCVKEIRSNNLRYSSACFRKEPSSQNSNRSLKASSTQEHRHVAKLNTPSFELETLRHEISVRDNQAKIQDRSVAGSIEGAPESRAAPRIRSHVARVETKASASTTGLTPVEPPLKCFRSSEISRGSYYMDKRKKCNINSDNDNQICRTERTLLIEGTEEDKTLPLSSEAKLPIESDSGSLLPNDDKNGRSNAVELQVFKGRFNLNHNVAPKNYEQSHSMAKPEDICTKLNQISKSAHRMSTAEALHESDICSPGYAEPQRLEQENHQQALADPGNLIPYGTCPITVESRFVPESVLAVGDATLRNMNPQNQSSQIDMPEAQGLHFDSLTKLEELHDKELEEAQEYRRRCELEERNALRAYRDAQRALLEANERCSMLYRKRELFSAQVRSLAIEASSSTWPSSQKNQKEALLESLQAVSGTRYDLLFIVDNEKKLEGRTSEQTGYKADGEFHCDHHTRSSFEAEKSPDHDGSIMVPKGNLNGVCTLVNSKTTTVSEEGRNSNKTFLSSASKSASHRSGGDQVENTLDVNESERIPSIEEALDYKLLEASLRSELVAHLGRKRSLKSNDGRNNAFHVDTTLGCAVPTEKSSASFDLQLQDGQKPQTLEGFDRQGWYDIPVHDGITSFTWPSSVPHNLARHLMLLCDASSDTTYRKEIMESSAENNIEQLKDVGNCVEEYSNRKRKTAMSYHGSDTPIDPFWAFCMFELRGKCNDEECSWQHLNNCSRKKLKQSQNSALASSDLRGGHVRRNGRELKACCEMVSIPSYQIGSWEYWQRGFCPSFPLNFSSQRVLPPDAPYLLGDNGHVADTGNWKRPSLYQQSLTGKTFMQESSDIEQLLELALDMFLGRFCRPDKRKALSLLRRAIEADPNSEVLWVVYLHIYYQKESSLGADDMFSVAVQHNEGSYDLWLMYINSRMQLTDRCNAYEYALATFCQKTKYAVKETKHISTCILDIFLQMIDFLNMSGNVHEASCRIALLLPGNNLGSSNDTLFSDVESCLVLSDRCLFWICCIYVTIYGRLPEEIVEFGFEKDLSFGLKWPAIKLSSVKKDLALKLISFAVEKISSVDSDSNNRESASLLSFMAVNHVKCVAAIDGLHLSAQLLLKYMEQCPTCLQLALLSARLKEEYIGDVTLRGFEEVLSSWPKKAPGVQFLWNQYAEYLLASGRTEQVQTIMIRWFECFCQIRDQQFMNPVTGKDVFSSARSYSSDLTSRDDLQPSTEDDMFYFLNLFLYKFLQKDARGARYAIDRALGLANIENFVHCAREHAAFIVLNWSETLNSHTGTLTIEHLKRYLGDHRACASKQLSRRYCENLRRRRVKLLVDNVLGPLRMDSSLLNALLEAFYGPSLLPETFEPQDFVDYVELLVEIVPANYQLALSVCKSISRYFNCDSIAGEAAMFWAAFLLVNSIFQSIPTAPEKIWLEAANFLKALGSSSISLRFLQQATTAYPFSKQLWLSYLNLAKMTGDASEIEKLAGEKGLDMTFVQDDY